VVRRLSRSDALKISTGTGQQLNIIIADTCGNPFKITTQKRLNDREGASEIVLNVG
jgi:hypothetical protein